MAIRKQLLELAKRFERIRSLREEREILIKYLFKKAESLKDWHAVADAAMDLREIEARIKTLEDMNED